MSCCPSTHFSLRAGSPSGGASWADFPDRLWLDTGIWLVTRNDLLLELTFQQTLDVTQKVLLIDTDQ